MRMAMANLYVEKPSPKLAMQYNGNNESDFNIFLETYGEWAIETEKVRDKYYEKCLKIGRTDLVMFEGDWLVSDPLWAGNFIVYTDYEFQQYFTPYERN